MRIPSTAEMTDLDQRTQAQYQIPGLLLMEHAALAILRSLEHRYGVLEGKEILLFCGTGNNGGDGFALARLLKLSGALPRVLLAGEPEKLKGDAARNFQSLVPLGIPVSQDLARQGKPDLIVDALLGTGSQGPARGKVLEAILRSLNLACPVVAVDIPSGLPGDGGIPQGEHVVADLTVTIGLPKPFAFCPVCRESVGELMVARIGFPAPLLRAPSFQRTLAVSGELARRVTPLGASTHKGERGRVLIIGGAPGMGGAAVLAARGALRGGAGLVKVLVPAGSRRQVATGLPEAMVLELGESWGSQVEELTRWADAVVVGPGLGEDGHDPLWKRLVEEYPGPLVVDADGLRVFDEGAKVKAQGFRLLTPHAGEAGRLLQKKIGPDLTQREDVCRRLRHQTGCQILLKGRFSLLATEGALSINPTGSPTLATGGTGDVLAGLLGASLAARGCESPEERVRLAVYLHGMAGDLAGPLGALTSEIADQLPRARSLLEGMSGRISAQGYAEVRKEDGLMLI